MVANLPCDRISHWGLFFFISLCLTAKTHADIFVSTSGLDTNTGLSDQDPVRSITKAAELAATVDTIYVMDDGFFDSTIIGLPKNLTITGFQGMQRVLDYSGTGYIAISIIPEPFRIRLVGLTFLRSFAITADVWLMRLFESHVEMHNCTVDVSLGGMGIRGTNRSLIATDLILRAGADLLSNSRIQYDGDAPLLDFSNLQVVGARGGNVIQTFSGSTIVRNSYLYNMTGNLVTLQLGSALIENVTMEEGRGSLVSCATAYPLCACSIISSRFRRLQLVGGVGFIQSLTFTSLTIVDSEFTEIDPGPRALIYSENPGNFSIIRSNFTSIRLKLVPEFRVMGSTMFLRRPTNLFIDSSRFELCGGPRTHGGAIAIAYIDTSFNATIEIRNSVFISNEGYAGGALFIQRPPKLIVHGCLFFNNSATESGGAIRSQGWTTPRSQISISSSKFSQNSATTNQTFIRELGVSRYMNGGGGAISFDGPAEYVSISNCDFQSNTATHLSGWADGGAVSIGAFLPIERINISSCNFIGNVAQGVEPVTGGALSISGRFEAANVSFCRFLGNRASILSSVTMFYDQGRRLAYGGAAFFAGVPSDLLEPKLFIHSSDFVGNSAAQGGAAVFQRVESTVLNASVAQNVARATTAGFLIISDRLQQRISSKSFQIYNTSFINNFLNSYGDVVRLSDCNQRGIQSQLGFQLEVCVSCNFVNMTAPSVPPIGSNPLPYGAHIGSVGGSLFLLRSPSNRNPTPYVSSCESSLIGGCTVVGIKMIQIRVRQDLLAIELVWSTKVTPGLSTQFDSCIGVLTNATLNQPGWNAMDSRCSILDGNVLVIESSALPYPGFVALLPTAFVERFFEVGPFAIQPPVDEIRSEAFLLAPPILDNCADTFVSGAGSKVPGVFPTIYTWSVDSYPVGDESVRDFILSQQNRSAFSLPASLWILSAQNRSLTISLIVRSVFGPYSKPATATMLRFSDPLPVIFLEGPAERKQYAAVETILHARVSIPSCYSLRGITVTREWKIFSGSPTSKLTDLFTEPWIGQSLYLPAVSMSPGSRYEFQFSARVDQLSTLNTTIVASVEAIFSPMMVYSTGDGGWVSKNKTIDLRVSVVDPDETTGTPFFVWDIGCVNASIVNLVQPVPIPDYIAPYENGRHLCLPQCPTFSFGFTSNNSLSPSSLADRVYTVFLDASKDSRSISTSFRLNVTSEEYFKIRLTPRWNGPKPLRDERIAVSATVNGAGLLNTTLYYAEWKVLNPATMAELPNIIDRRFVATPLDGSALAIAFRPNTFQQSEMYVIQLTILDALDRSRILGRNWIDLQINSPPIRGSVLLSESRFFQFQPIQVTALDWEDADAPLRFSISVALSEDPDDEYLLADSLDTQSISLTIPFSGNFNLKVRIIDSLGAASVVTMPLDVRPEITNSSVLIEDFLNLLRVGDLRRATGLFSYLAQTQNQTLRPILARSIRPFISQSRITSANAQILLRLLLKINVTREDTVDICLLAVDILCDITDAVYTSSSFGSSVSRLLFSQTLEGIRSLQNFVSLLSSTLLNLRVDLGRLLDADRRVRLISSSLRLTSIMSRVSVLNEELTSSNSSLAAFEALSLVRCGDQPIDLSIRGNGIRILPIGASNCTLGAGIAITSSYWSNGTFPLPIFQNHTSWTIIPIQIISIVINPRESVATYFNISVTFSDFQVPSTPPPPDARPQCVQLDTASHRWTNAGCTLSTQNARYVCTCTPRSVPATGGSGILVSVIFGDFANEADTLTIPPPPGSYSAPAAVTSSAPLLGSNQGGSEIAVAAIVATVVVVVVAVAVVIGGLLLFKHRQQKASEKLKQALTSGNAGTQTR